MQRSCLGYPGHRCATLIRGASRCDPCQLAKYQVRNRTRDQGARALYSSAAWKRLRESVVGNATACHWCRTTREYAVLTADHIERVTDRPDLALVRDNVVPACRSCQNRRQARPDPTTWQAWERSPRVTR